MKASTDKNVYKFIGFDVKKATENATYVAKFAEVNDDIYKVTFVSEGQKEILQETAFVEGDTPKYTGETPIKHDDDMYVYEFAYWTNTDGEKINLPDVKVTKDVTYVAAFKSKIKEFVIEYEYIDENGEIITDFVNCLAGEKPVFKDIPKSIETEDADYIFMGFDKAIVNATENTFYKAEYEIKNKYKIRFIDDVEPEVLLKETVVYEGETPIYSGTTPSKPETEYAKYVFDHWSRKVSDNWEPGLVPAAENKTYKAEYFETRKYSVKFVNYDSTEILQDSIYYVGETPVYNGDIPTKSENNEYIYVFNGWNKDIVPVTEETIYVATFEEVEKQYDITFKFLDENGADVLQEITTKYKYGIIPSTEYEELIDTDLAKYEFIGWDKEFVVSTENATYVATYKKTPKYLVKFKNGDEILQEETILKGETPTYKGVTPTKTAEDGSDYIYQFTGWNSEIEEVNGNKEYVAQFKEIYKRTIKFLNYDGSLLEGSVYFDGETPTYKGSTPIREEDEYYKYTFTGWNSEIEIVSKDASYIAQYSRVLKPFVVTFENYDHTVLQSRKYMENSIPVYNGETPTKEGDGEYVYVFDGWNSEITPVIEDKTYVAAFKAIKIYSVKFKSDSTILFEDIYKEGEMPKYEGETPVKADTSDYVYEFKGWDPEITKVDSEKTYNATFREMYKHGYVKFTDGTVKYWNEIGNRFVSNSLVNALAHGWIDEHEKVATVVIPEGVETIGENAFAGFSSMTEIVIPSSVNEIEAGAFKDCANLKKITVSEDNAKYDSRDNSNLIFETLSNKIIVGSKAGKIPLSANIIGEGSFENSALTSIELPDSITKIEKNAFRNSKSLAGVKFGNGLTEIEEEAFANCSSLANITLKDGLTKIGNKAFYNCSLVKKIEIPETVTSIGRQAFYALDLVEEIVIPNSVTSLGIGAFERCYGLQKVKIGEGITTINQDTFKYCTNLTSIGITGNVTTIDENCLYTCDNFEFIEFTGTIGEWNDKNISIVRPAAFIVKCSDGDITYEPTLMSRLLNAFGMNISTMKTSVVTKEMDLEPAENTYENNAESSNANPLQQNSLVTLNSSNPVINKVEKTNAADSIVINAENRELIGYTKDTTKLAMPSSIVGNDDNGLKAGEHQITGIADQAFMDCTNLTEVIIPNGVTRIGKDAFRKCNNLAEITIPKSVTSIGFDAFYNCEKLEVINYKGTVTEFNNITKYSWDTNTGSYIIKCTDGVISK